MRVGVFEVERVLLLYDERLLLVVVADVRVVLVLPPLYAARVLFEDVAETRVFGAVAAEVRVVVTEVRLVVFTLLAFARVEVPLTSPRVEVAVVAVARVEAAVPAAVWRVVAVATELRVEERIAAVLALPYVRPDVPVAVWRVLAAFIVFA